VATVASANLVSVPRDLFAAKSEKTHQIWMGAKASMTNSDGILDSQSYRNECMGHTFDDEAGNGKGVDLKTRAKEPNARNS
jgi:hypothetical protein